MVASRTGRHVVADRSSLIDSRSAPALPTPMVGPALRQRILWWMVAIVTGWMATTMVTTAVIIATSVQAEVLIAMTAIGSLVTAVALYLRFRHLGRIDETVVLVIVIGWAAMLGLLSF